MVGREKLQVVQIAGAKNIPKQTHTHTHTHTGRNLLDVKVSQIVDETLFIPSLHRHFRFRTLGKVKLLYCMQ